MNYIPFLILFLAPVIALFAYLIYRPGLNSDSRFLLKMCFIYGILTYMLFYLLNLLSSYFDLNTTRSFNRTLFTAFIVQGGAKQLCILLFLILMVIHNKGFSRSFHGIIFTIMIALGCVSTENVYYVFNNGGHNFTLIRAFTSIPGSIIFAILMGFFVGQSRFRKMKWWDCLLGLGAASFFNGIYDFCLFSNDYLLLGIFGTGSFAIAVSLYVKALNNYRHGKSLEEPQTRL
jgi:RsiW-degrading membrane proteinase PrsW (M82 family)